MLHKLRFVEAELFFFFSLSSLNRSGKPMPASAEAVLNRWMITHKLEYKRIWTELEHVSVEFAFQLGSWSGGC